MRAWLIQIHFGYFPVPMMDYHRQTYICCVRLAVYNRYHCLLLDSARLRPISVLGIGIGPIPAVSGGIGYRRYCSRYRPIPVGCRCNDKMPKYRIDRLISLPAAMAANGVDSSMHNQPCAIMLFTAFYNDLRPPTTCDNWQLSPAGRPQAKFQEIRRTQQTLSRMQSTARRDSDWMRGRQRCVNASL